MRVSLSDEAQTDANAATDWYIDDGAFVAAEDFANALDQAYGLLCDFPYMASKPFATHEYWRFTVSPIR